MRCRIEAKIERQELESLVGVIAGGCEASGLFASRAGTGARGAIMKPRHTAVIRPDRCGVALTAIEIGASRNAQWLARATAHKTALRAIFHWPAGDGGCVGARVAILKLCVLPLSGKPVEIVKNGLDQYLPAGVLSARSGRQHR
jgi:hypothetical protein